MKQGKKWLALLLVAAMLCAFVGVCALSVSPGHTHNEPDAHCVVCIAVMRAGSLLRAAHALTAAFVLLLSLVLLGVLCSLHKTRRVLRPVTPVTLKTKLSW